MSPEERLMKLEQNMAFISEFASSIGGQNKAFESVIAALLPFHGQIPEIAAAVRKRLEEATAQNLGGSTNQNFVDGFDSAKEVILHLLNTSPDA